MMAAMVAGLMAGTVADGRVSEPGFDVVEASIADLSAALGSGKVSSRELVEAYLARIAAYDRAGPALGAIVTLNRAALDQADQLDRERKAGSLRGPLHGIPVLVKDNYDTADMPTSGGTLALATLQPTADAEQVARLRAAGAIILGKTAMHELASGITTISSLTGYARNPYDPRRSPGGSSGGTAAAVAASFAAAGMGTDTCGSIRIPAAYQNLYGLRATQGQSSLAGIVPLSLSQDVAGPLARSVEDLAIMLDATVDMSPTARRIPYRQMLVPDALKGARIGVVRQMFGQETDMQDGRTLADGAIARMRAAGAILVDVALPGLDDLLKDSGLIPFEMKPDLAAYLAAHPGAPVTSLSDIIDKGLAHTTMDARLRTRNPAGPRDEKAYAAALAKREKLRALMIDALAGQQLDALLYPTSLRSPPLLDADYTLLASCQLSANSGLPAIEIPIGLTEAGQPIGLELLGPASSEAALLRLAYGWEQAAHPRVAPFSTPPLQAGKAPAPQNYAASLRTAGRARTVVKMRYDPTTAMLDVDARVTGLAPDELVAVALHRGKGGAPGPVLVTLLGPGGMPGKASIFLTAPDRAALLAGDVYAVLYTRGAPLGAARGAVKPSD